MIMKYKKQNFKIPKQSADYQECSNFITRTIENIIKEAIDKEKIKLLSIQI